MTRIAEIIRFYSLDEIMEFIEKGGEYPRHHLWCYDKLKEQGKSVEWIEYDKNARWNKIIEVFNFRQQLNLMKRMN